MKQPRRTSSVASSVTLGRTPRSMSRPTSRPSSRTPVRPPSQMTALSEDVDMADADTTTAENYGERRFIVAVDYGTTMSSVSYAVVLDQQKYLFRKDVNLIGNYPDDPSTGLLSHQGTIYPPPSNEVPSEVWYPDKNAKNYDPFDFSIREPAEAEQDDSSTNSSGDEGEDIFNPKTYWRDVPDSIYWGYSAQPDVTHSDTSDFATPRNSRIKWAKLQLAEDHLKTGYSEKTQESFIALKNDKVVRKELDFITDFLTCLFKHVKAELQEKHDLKDHEPIEMILCVPVAWSCKANRDMHAAMDIAVKNSGLGRTTPGCIDNLFIVSEPEAAAAYVLEEGFQIDFNDTFVLIDAGGGTVDAVTYNVTNTQPLRLRREAVEPGGDLCGSSYLNEDFRAFVKERLKDELYILQLAPNMTMDDFIEDRIMKKFEYLIKRYMNFDIPSACNILFDVPGLKESREKRFRWNKLPVKRDEFFDIFQPRMAQVAGLMEEQLNRCREKGIDVHKVVLIGGYGDNKALQAHLRSRLEEFSRRYNIRIALKTAPKTGSAAAAVSAGAVLRAFNKEQGPNRILQSSYGFLRREHKTSAFAGHRGAKGTWDYTEGDRFVDDTLFWVFLRGEEVAQRSTHILPAYRTFGLNEPCIVTEKFYVSDKLTESHWQMTSTKNKGNFEFAGTFEIDISDWRDRGWMQHVIPQKGKQGREHWVAAFDIIMELTGRSMRCWARYPSQGGLDKRVQHEVTDGVQLPGSQIYMSVAAAFQPGTK